MIDEGTMRTIHQLRRVTVALNLRGAEFAAAQGLHTTDLRAIISLLDADREGIAATPGWLGEQLQLNSASVTALVDRLARLGLVRRDRDTADRRRVLLTVEPSATELGWAFFGPLMGRIAEVAGAFDQAELAVVDRFLAGVLTAAGSEGAGDEAAGDVRGT
ncbi:DNA-binding MarR family transcriptional regulator [Allocatelliglobosispora scoriae]|uniref:DNA-binding MarR family transcriptional regulator n=1 Tax=Allocatelliglobosispora scoriae TaxID=643052 RepID=A0A841BXM1_9ACTN|nr:MarR family transcriptional regulator [Allocatelliglobosispora scoriae]MBB5873897.1 DNA-binding MarR family transcriptional regulator [Allocatelliglobosispora scoriae]